MKKNHPVYMKTDTFVYLCLALRSYDDHQAVSKDADSHQQVRKRESELQHPDRSIVVVVSVEQKGVLAESLLIQIRIKTVQIAAGCNFP